MDTLARLKSVPLFASLAPDALARVAQLATRHSYPKGSALCQEDEFGETLFVIDSGEAVIRQTDARGAERPTGYLRDGGFVGEDALLLGDAYGTCVEATKDVEALVVRKRDFDSLLGEYPHIRRQLAIRALVRERLRVPSFPWLGDSETPLLIRRRHWVVFVRTLPVPALAVLIPGIVLLLLREAGSAPSFWFSVLFLGILPALMLLWFWMDWRNDFYLVTTQRIVHREKLVLIYEAWDEAPLTKIQDTRITRGFFGKLFKYGNMRIETASARGSILLDHLPDPEGMQEVIDKQVRTLRWRSRRLEREEIYQQLLVQTGRSQPASVEPPVDLPKKKLGILAGILPSRPLLRLRYEQAERIVWRKHWIFLLRRIWFPLPAALLFSAFAVVARLSRLPSPFGSSVLLVSLVLWIAATLWLLWELEDWRNDEYILTDRAVVDVEKRPLFFAEERKQAGLDKIENVSFSIPGPLANILNFGDVLIQTAGAGAPICFRNVPHPAEIQGEVFRRMEAYNEGQRHREREQRKTELSNWFEVYDQMTRGEPPPPAG
jgi:membrane protein YdbS with pleckstrin-like domain